MEELVKEFLKDNKAEDLYEPLMDFLVCNEQIRWWIFRDVEKDYHREDVRNELIDMNFEKTDDEIEKITEYYEDELANSEDWRYCLRYAIERFKEE